MQGRLGLIHTYTLGWLILLTQHTYHTACIDQWLKTSTLCPLCKQNVLVQAAPPPVDNPPPVRLDDLEITEL